ncbi:MULTISPECIES: hypothetical protein [Priestia]|uniref:hypothetical protein n=1 Tax=Priestia TaxID=2800373 RepID=UPI0013FA33B5|nr:hypothetical protein [Priestia megaterium]MBW0933604.1 hypothetical protein [Priestia megaterium]NGY69656.1 hypothetical protein [Priestia megaterium]NGY69761.1 hypothetical protein [Priestia megaterium]
MSKYQLTLANRSIEWGTQFDINPLVGQFAEKSIKSHEENGSFDWDLPSGVYRAKDIVRELNILLEAIMVQLGEAADSKAMLDNLEANLAISGRESVLPLGQLSLNDTSGIELTKQAKSIGETLTRWASEFNSQQLALKEYGEAVLNNLNFRSHCDNHPWTPKVANLLLGSAGSPTVMQLFNEYLHQLVLLRDALIPFENWEEIPIKIDERNSVKGLRFMEQAHSEFLYKLLGKRMSHKALVKFAQSVLSSELTTVGYGFQYHLGTILPASLGALPATAPRYLLYWHPVWTIVDDNFDVSIPITFNYEFPDYLSAPRSNAGDGQVASELDVLNQELENVYKAQILTTGNQQSAVLKYHIQLGSNDFVVDLGQIFRGQRFMYRPATNSKSVSGAHSEKPADFKEHHVWGILETPGLITNESGNHLISARGNYLILWALLGKLYPENVIILNSLSEEEFKAANITGKGFGAKFLIH